MHYIFNIFAYAPYFSAIVVISWLVISNSLPKFFTRRCHGNQTMNLFYKFHKNSSRMHCIFNTFESAVCWWPRDRRFQLCYWNLQGRLPWQLNFAFHSQNCIKLAITLIICTVLSFFSAVVVFSWLAISNSLPKFSRDVAMSTKLWIYYINLVKTPVVCTAYSTFFCICWWHSIGDFR